MKSGRMKRILLSVIAFLFVGCSIAGGTVLLSNSSISDNTGGENAPSENEITKNAPTNSDLWTNGHYATAFDNEGEAGIDGTTEEKAYEIRTAEQLALLAYRINTSSTNSTYCSLYYVQTADIDLSLHYWDAIGYGESRCFSGNYNGFNHTISGLFISKGADEGLFGYVEGDSRYAVISNIGIINSNIFAFNGTGAIVGNAANLYIKDCFNKGSVTGSVGVGGICGTASGFVEIRNCSNFGEIQTNETQSGYTHHAGGILGEQDMYSGNVSIYDCCNFGDIKAGLYDYVGGICSDANRVTRCYNFGDISGNDTVGGIAGTASRCKDCYNIGDVRGYRAIGGISGAGSDIINCYNGGKITGTGDSVGGICGYCHRIDIVNCYNFGRVSGSSDIGGISGYEYVTWPQNCYVGGNCTIDVNDTELLTHARDINWYLNSSNWNGSYAWDFENVWTIVPGVNDGFPILRNMASYITYVSNFGENETVTENSPAGESVVIAGVDLFEREGYTISSWNTMADGSGDSFAPGFTFEGGVSLTLYAQWERMAYTVTFDANGGSGTMSSVEKNYNEDLVLPANEFTKTGYNFKGWATSANGSVVYGDGAKYTANASATLYAQWEAKIIQINLDKDGGSGGTSAIYLKYDSGWYSSSSCTSSSKITALPSTPTRTGYEFKGYSTEPDGSGTLAVSATGAINVSDTFYSTDGSRTWYAVWEARNPAYYDRDGGFWYLRNGKLPQSKVSDSLKSTLSGRWSSLSKGAVYYMGVEELANSEFASDGGMQSKVYNGEEYVKFNGEFYLVEPIRWRLVYSSSQKEGYAVENTSVLATMAEIVFVGSYSSAKIGVGAGHSAESVTMLLKNQISDEYLVSESREVEIFGAPKDTASVSGSVFVASSEELANFKANKNNTTGSGVKPGKVSLSDFVKDYLRATGQGNYYFTRDLGDQLNTILCLNPVGDRSQAKAQQTLGVQFTIKVTEYACKSV